jgi:hypothetical protein
MTQFGEAGKSALPAAARNAPKTRPQADATIAGALNYGGLMLSSKTESFARVDRIVIRSPAFGGS